MIRVAVFFSLFIFGFNAFSQIATDSLLHTNNEDSIEIENKLPVFTTTVGELDAEVESQDISGILQSSRDLFNSVAGFSFGSARFRIRGLGSENTLIMINGIGVNDPESGYAAWSGWGGLNDVTRYMQVKTGVNSNRQAFGGIGGSTSIEARASSFRKGTRVSYAASNRSYSNRLMLTHGTGLMDNGWAFSFSGSRRWAEEGYVEGTFFDAWSYFMAAEKKMNERHSIGIIGFGAPLSQGRQGVSMQEANDLSGSNYYNPYWGYQDGKKRNSRVSNVHKPMGILTHYWSIGSKSKLNSSLFYSQGRNGITGINWYDAKDPRPDYYKYLPSYYKTVDEKYASLTSLWQSDVSTRQVNWDQFYFANGKNLYTVMDANGISGTNFTGNRSKYIVEELRSDQTISGVNLVYTTHLMEKMHVSAGLNSSIYKNNYFKVLEDMLGGDFWLDVDQFSERDLKDENASQNDLDQVNRLVKKGDRFGYDYTINLNKTEAFAQAEYSLSKLDLYVGASGSKSEFWRTGNVRNGRFPEESEGESEKYQFTNYGLKGGLEYKISGRHFITSNAAYLTRAPFARNAFVSPRTRDKVVNGLENELIKAADISYVVRYPNFKSRLSAYVSEFENQVMAKSYYHDDFRTFVNYTMSGVNTKQMGAELGAEYSIASFALSGVYAHGYHVYNSRPIATITRDNSAELLAEDRVIYLKNYRIGNMPQKAASIGLKYTGSKFWFAGCSLNYFDDIFLEANPDRRTEEALSSFVESDAGWQEIIDQEQLPSAYTLDAFAGKSWKIYKSYFVNLNLSVSNILDNRTFATGGFEQLRYDVRDLNKFPPKYNYNYGRTFFAMISLRF